MLRELGIRQSRRRKFVHFSPLARVDRRGWATAFTSERRVPASWWAFVANVSFFGKPVLPSLLHHFIHCRRNAALIYELFCLTHLSHVLLFLSLFFLPGAVKHPGRRPTCVKASLVVVVFVVVALSRCAVVLSCLLCESTNRKTRFFVRIHPRNRSIDGEKRVSSSNTKCERSRDDLVGYDVYATGLPLSTNDKKTCTQLMHARTLVSFASFFPTFPGHDSTIADVT